MVYWPTTVLWKLETVLSTLKAHTTSRVLVEARNKSYGRVFLESSIFAGLKVPID